VFVHKHLLHERSSYLKECIDEGEKENGFDDPDDRGPLVVKLDRTSHTACIKLACWVYGQPIYESTYDFDQDLEDLVGIHDISFKADDDSSKWDMECIHACLEGIEQILGQKGAHLRDPIRSIETVFMQLDGHPGRSKILKLLVHGVCADDGRTEDWLDEYRRHIDHDLEFIEQVCLEFAGKSCGQSDPDTPIPSTVEDYQPVIEAPTAKRDRVSASSKN
jgi:hypothetical protein